MTKITFFMFKFPIYLSNRYNWVPTLGQAVFRMQNIASVNQI